MTLVNVRFYPSLVRTGQEDRLRPEGTGEGKRGEEEKTNH